MADGFGSGMDMGADAAPAPQPQQGGFFGGATGFGAHYQPSDPATSPLDQAADLLTQRAKRANQIATNPLAQFFAPEQAQAAREFAPKAAEQLQQIEKQKADIAAGRKQAVMLGLDPGEVSDQATREDRVTAAQQRALRGDLKAFQGLQAVDPKAAEAIQDQVHSAVAAHLTTAQSAFDKLSNARGQGDYTKALGELRQGGSIAGLEALGLKVPDKFDAFNAAKGREAEALRNARIGVDTIRQKLEDRNTYQPMEEKEAKTYNGRMTTAYGDQITNGTWSRNSAAGTRGLIVNGAGHPNDLGKSFALATPEQRKAIGEEFKEAVPKEDMEKFRAFNRTYDIATRDSKGGSIPPEGVKNAKGELSYVNTNPNVQQGIAEGLASMLRGGSGGANVGLLKIELAKRGWAQGAIDGFVTNYAGALNTMFRDANAEGKPYLSQRTQKQIRDVMDALHEANDSMISDRAAPIARRAGALGLDSAALGFGTKESTGAVGAALEEGRKAQVDRMTPSHQAIGGGDGVFQIGAQRPGAGATGTPQGTQPATQLPGAPPLLTPVQQATNPAGPPPGTSPPAAGPPAAGVPGGPSPPQLGAPNAPAQPPVASIPSNYVDEIKKTEGFEPRAKWDYKQFTNGYGTRAAHSAEVLDKETADKRFNTEIGKAASFVDKVNPNLDPGTRAALTSLTFNSGEKWAESGLGEKIKAGDLAGAKALFLQYNKAGGEVNQGLASRRVRESRWFGQADAESSPDTGPRKPPPLRAAEQDPRLAAQNDPGYRARVPGVRGGPRDVPDDQTTWGDVGRGATEHAPAIGGMAGMVAGGVAGGPGGAVAGGALGGGAGQSLKDWLFGNPQSATQIAKQAALGGVLGVVPEGRPIVGAATRMLGAGAVEGGARAAEGGDAGDIAEAAATGTGAAALGEGFGRALGMAGHKVYSLFTSDAQKAVRTAAADLHAANEALKTEPPKLAGAAGAAATANPKYEAAQAAKEKAEAALKEMMPNAKPDEVAYAHKVESEGVPRQEAGAARPGAIERENIGAGYRQLETEVGNKGVGAPKASPKLVDGPIAAVENKAVSARHAELAQRTEAAITAPAKDWQAKWTQLKDVRSALLDAERDATTSTAPGRTKIAEDMRTLADTVRAQQVKAANAVFGPVKGPEVIKRLEMLDTRYARLMKATNGGDLDAAARMKGEAGRNADRAFRAFAQNDHVAVAAWTAMRGKGPDVERDIRTLVGAEKIPVLGHLISAAKLLGGYNQWRAERAAGSAARFEDFVPELKGAGSRAARNVLGSAGARALIDRLTDQLGGNREMALSILRDRGHVEQGSERLTAEGAYREALGPAGRAIDRATKTSGRLARDYEYDARTNRATLIKK